MPRPKLRTPELRDLVLDVALETLASQGVAGFTTRKVAGGASTSTKAVYELFGDRSGLVRDIFFAGFRQLGARLEAIEPTDDAGHDLQRVLTEIRAFARQNPVLTEVMFSRPFADFDPGPDELAAGALVRELIVDRVRRYLRTRDADRDPTDVAHVLLALVQGLSAQEAAGWLGTSEASIQRRWDLALDTALAGIGALKPVRRYPAKRSVQEVLDEDRAE